MAPTTTTQEAEALATARERYARAKTESEDAAAALAQLREHGSERQAHVAAVLAGERVEHDDFDRELSRAQLRIEVAGEALAIASSELEAAAEADRAAHRAAFEVTFREAVAEIDALAVELERANARAVELKEEGDRQFVTYRGGMPQGSFPQPRLVFNYDAWRSSMIQHGAL